MKKKLLTGIIATTLSVATSVPSLVSCAKVTSIEITGPNTVTLSETGTYVANVEGEGDFDTSVNWSLIADSELGAKISQDGKLTTGSKPGQVTVVATSVSNPKIDKSMVVQIISPVSGITVTSEKEEIYADSSSTSQFSASVATTGEKYKDVIWSIKEVDKHGATISPSGLLTAPNSTCNLTIVATSKIDSTKFGEKTIHATRVKSIAITDVEVIAGQPTQLVSTVTYIDDTTDSNTLWETAQSFDASITPDGILTTDEDVVQDVEVKATSTDDETKTCTATIHCTTLKTITITGLDELYFGQEQQYVASAEITGGSTPTFKWVGVDTETGSSIDEDTGAVTAGTEGKPGDYKIIAIPNIDEKKSISKTIHITPIKDVIMNYGSDVLASNTSIKYDFDLIKWDGQLYSKNDITVSWKTESGDFDWDSETSTLSAGTTPGNGTFILSLKEYPNEKKEVKIQSFKQLFTVTLNEQDQTAFLDDWSEDGVRQLFLKNLRMPNVYVKNGVEYKITGMSKSMIAGHDRYFGKREWLNTLEHVSFESPCYLKELPHSCFFNTLNLQRVDVPDEIETIGVDCFRQCENLTNINFTENSQVKAIDADFMSLCYSLESIKFPPLLEKITYGYNDGSGTLATNMRVLKNIEIASTNPFFSSYDGSNCLVTSQDITTIDGKTISSNTLVLGAVNTVIPQQAKYIFRGAFRGNDTIKSINIPGNIKSIGFRAFYGCDLLENVTFNEGLEKIEGSAFNICPIKKLNLPSSLKEIDESAFVKFEETNVPKGIKLKAGALNSGNMRKIDLSLWGLTDLPQEDDWATDVFDKCSNGGTIIVAAGMSDTQKQKWLEVLTNAGLDISNWVFDEVK